MCPRTDTSGTPFGIFRGSRIFFILKIGEIRYHPLRTVSEMPNKSDNQRNSNVWSMMSVQDSKANCLSTVMCKSDVI